MSTCHSQLSSPCLYIHNIKFLDSYKSCISIPTVLFHCMDASKIRILLFLHMSLSMNRQPLNLQKCLSTVNSSNFSPYVIYHYFPYLFIAFHKLWFLRPNFVILRLPKIIQKMVILHIILYLKIAEGREKNGGCCLKRFLKYCIKRNILHLFIFTGFKHSINLNIKNIYIHVQTLKWFEAYFDISSLVRLLFRNRRDDKKMD